MLQEEGSPTEAALLKDEESRRQFVLQDTASFLASDLKSLFERGEITESRCGRRPKASAQRKKGYDPDKALAVRCRASDRYAPDIVFEDPITRYTSREGYGEPAVALSPSATR